MKYLTLLFLTSIALADAPEQLSVALAEQAANPAGNSVYLTSSGNNNTVTVLQDTMSVNGTYQNVNITGDSNTVTQIQRPDSADSAVYIFSTITGNSNSTSISQSGTGTKGVFDVIIGNNNSLSATQTGAGNHLLDATLIGNNNVLDVVQAGDLTNHATINLTNAGGANNVTVNQVGGQTYTLQQTCVTPSGCSATVTQR
jgi:hypothetical protein